MGATCAVVGANGFLGKELVKQLIYNNYIVTAVYNNSHSEIPATVDKLSIGNFIKIKKKYDFVILAIGNFNSKHSELIDINSKIHEILKNNISAKIIFISSTNVYGIHDDVIELNSSFNIPTLYPLSKLAGEFLVSSHYKFSIIRLTYLYGNGLNNGSFLPNLIQKSKETGKITLFGNGERKQDYLHIDDAVNLCIKAMETDINGFFIGASGTSTSNREIAEIVSLAHSSEIEYQGVETGSSFYFDIKNSCEMLDWSPKINIEDGVKNMLR
ncbi:NAD-dependent epimerase/dehydratase family protein [Pedobacter sp. 22226]|uniref:NAD-dependent epimerase/dehydratase family protein n=1 Tax=Pedobacter sp. 22226 TaxID=3453894 RepID=UPI003F86F3CB